MKIIDTFYGAYYDEREMRERPLGSIDFGKSENISSFTLKNIFLFFSFPVSQIKKQASSDT